MNAIHQTDRVLARPTAAARLLDGFEQNEPNGQREAPRQHAAGVVAMNVPVMVMVQMPRVAVSH